MLTPMDFEDDFIKFLKNNIAKKFKLKGCNKYDNKRIYKNPNVIKGFLIPKMNGESDVSELPFICFRMNELKTIKINQQNIHCIKTIILFGCYCQGYYNVNNKNTSIEDGSGYRDIWNIMEYTRQTLFNGIYIPKVRLFEDTFSMEMPSEQYYPIWEGHINADFLIGIPNWEMR